jgi:preprotein translocase subunit YajC
MSAREVLFVELLLPLVGIALLWFFLIRPASRRQKDLARMQSALTVGDEVMLTSGVYGTVTAVADDHALVEVATGVAIKVARGAVGQIVTTVDEPAETGTVDLTKGSDQSSIEHPADRPARTDGPTDRSGAEED